MSADTNANSRNKKAAPTRSTIKSKTTKQKSVNKASPALKKQKKKTNLLRLCSEMSKYADDANDKEIIKRFKTTITSSVNEDIPKTRLTIILKKTEEVNINDFDESLQPYIKHYLFMVNRSKNKNK